MSSPSYADIDRFMKNEKYPNQFDVSTKEFQQHASGLPMGLKAVKNLIKCLLQKKTKNSFLNKTTDISQCHNNWFIFTVLREWRAS